MIALAKERNGNCLSKIYINDATKLTWGCNVCSAIWDASPNNIKHGKWCPTCGRIKASKSRKIGIKEIKKTCKKIWRKMSG
jgi:hypothetical protein